MIADTRILSNMGITKAIGPAAFMETPKSKISFNSPINLIFTEWNLKKKYIKNHYIPLRFILISPFDKNLEQFFF